MSWTFRCRGPAGQTTLSGINPDSLLKDFLDVIAAQTGVPVAAQEILTGFPPRVLQMPTDTSAVDVRSLPITNGDTLTVRKLEGAVQASAPITSHPATAGADLGMNQGTGYTDSTDVARDRADMAAAIAASMAHVRPPVESAAARHAPASGPSLAPAGHPGPAPTSVSMPDGSCVVRRIIDSDNSCLFNAVGYVMEHSRHKAAELRSVIAGVVSSDPVTYNEAYLGKENEEYCKWITSPDKWGGAIELAILATYYGREIAAYDIQTKRCDVYAQDAGYSERAMLIYDGLHYDSLAVSPCEGAPEEVDITILQVPSPDATAAAEAATKLVAAAHSARQFTDTSNFTLRCGMCQIGLKGEKEAVEHAKATGHSNFSEY